MASEAEAEAEWHLTSLDSLSKRILLITRSLIFRMKGSIGKEKERQRVFCGCCGRLMEFSKSSTSFVCFICDTINDLTFISSPTLDVQGIDLKSFRELFEHAKISNDYDYAKDYITEIFSNSHTPSISFILQPSTGELESVDYDMVKEFYDIIKRQPPIILQSMMTSIDHQLRRPGHPFSELKEARFLLILLENPLLSRKKNRTELNFHHRLYSRLFGWLVHAGLYTLPISYEPEPEPDGKAVISEQSRAKSLQWTNFVMGEFARRSVSDLRHWVEVTNHYINTRITKCKTAKNIYSDWGIVVAAKFMSILSSVNALEPKLSVCEFYNTAIDLHIVVEEDYVQWHSNFAVFCFCQYPFLISMGSKLRILQADAKSQMDIRVIQSIESVRRGRNIELPFLTLSIRRPHLLRDSLAQISNKTNELKKKLKVQFVDEPGVDAGGLAKEWLLLLTRELFLPQYGMFLVEEDTRLSWFNQSNTDNDEEYFLCGVILGLAIYNSIILDVHFPLACYKKMLYQPLTLYDLQQFKPSLAKGLKLLLEYEEEDFETVFARHFVVTIEAYGEKKEVPLLPNGSTIAVTRENRHEFVNLYIDYIFNESVKRQFDKFLYGFNLVCAGNALSLFRPEELEMLVCGNPEIDINAMKSITEYEGFLPDEEFVDWYWELVQNFSEEQKRQFMSFLTGTDRMPAIEGTQIRIKLTCVGDDSERLPVAHTCFNQLCLYRYATQSKLEEKLLKAITESEGFGLK